jgi:hypothetical protein
LSLVYLAVTTINILRISVMAEEQQPVVRSREPNAMFDTYLTSQISNEFADGIGGVMSGPVITKMELYRVIGFEGEGANRIEKREMFMRLSLPSVALIEALGNILAGYAASAPQFEQAAKATNEVVIAALKKVKDVKL